MNQYVALVLGVVVCVGPCLFLSWGGQKMGMA